MGNKIYSFRKQVEKQAKSFFVLAIGSVVRSENRLTSPNMNLPVIINQRRPFQSQQQH